MNSKHRLLFCKEGTAKYISHLDLMRTMQRAFLRAELPIRHTEGFNPHAFVSVALPLPVGHASRCELMDFELLDESLLEDVPSRMNPVLPEGLRVLEAYVSQRPFKELAYLRSRLELFYDRGGAEEAGRALRELFSRETLPVTKTSKRKGEIQIDLIPLVRDLEVSADKTVLTVTAIHLAQNPTVNPELLVSALSENVPDFVPDFASYLRLEPLDEALSLFR
ncbi:TIGR03936 family radical SAM-associated protein [Papillibacter cinnamivorans]|uniref:Radical SAM-linked protein n=1 Tax=Papillibacter cinnamivorans DSM 12816 TaxID=1122930 RepID=A0A1W1YTY2_9FIRM|nr:TIGR03936 family radical SAM-associated protein [Papillibacter cinnamivorans]SMC39609.1 radical SAM-linked protein [Papillibacter cinnamivorans DSM 12816]